ncbi:MAG: hypothetical protein M3Y56_01795 [Armatimonadota bacterium]|nr:hypothetical protein [Armatimonadota bacterium]
MIAALVLFLVAVLGWRLVRRPGAPIVAGASYRPLDESLAALTFRFESLLARKGIPCPPGRPWLEHLSKAAAEKEPGDGSEKARSTLDLLKAERFVGEYYSVRFGGLGDRERLMRLDGLLDTLER